MSPATEPRGGSMTTPPEAHGTAGTPWARSMGSEPTWGDLEEVFLLKHGDPATFGWGPRMRRRFGYFTPDEVYEALVGRLVEPESSWLDVGCGREIFPNNRPLAGRLAARCRVLVGVDPDDNLDANPHVHERAKTTIDDYRSGHRFDLVTLRMVAEHITDPETALTSLARLTRPGGKVVVYTVNRWSPVALAAKAIPFGLHHAIKRVLWRTEERDTFPVAYRMNTRRALRGLFERHGFREASFGYLDDCRTFGRFRLLNHLELIAWRLLHVLRLRYPENCLLGVYERTFAEAVQPETEGREPVEGGAGR
jgi:SAM-dependent methyltransferase